MPGTMSTNSIPVSSVASSSSTNVSLSGISHKRLSLCCPPGGSPQSAAGSASSHHRRSSLQHNVANFKSTYKDSTLKVSGSKDTTAALDDFPKSTSKISNGDDKLIVVLSAAESGCGSFKSNFQGWYSKDTAQQQSKVVSNERPRTPSDEQRIPDSTTSQMESKQCFSSGDDVFVKQKDGRYYLGTVMRSSPGGERWLVRFGDETERWAGGNELRPLGMGCDENEESVLCVVCKVRGSSGEVIACDKCGRGYHRDCHSPDNYAQSPPTSCAQDLSWQCKRCVEQRFKAAASENRAMRRDMLKRRIVKAPEILPYNLNSLHWDNQHRENTEDKYCYCGNSGNWFKEMLQCIRCRQWFHQNCISCLRHPLYSGDRFYIFACSICNGGLEFLRRIELEWVDLVHLMLFNLTVYHSKKYYDLETVIIPYIADNWYALQLPAEMQALTPSQRRERIVHALTANRNRFKCGRETKKRASIWGLRTRDPPSPPVPSSPLPLRGAITEATLTNRITFIPETDSPTSSQDFTRERRMIVPIDSHWVSVMTGRRFQDISSDNDSLDSSPSPVDEIMSINKLDSDTSDIFTNNHDSSFVLDKLNSNDKLSTPVVKRKELKLYEMNYQGCGFVKKSVPFTKSPLHHQITKPLNKRKKFMDSLRQRCEAKEEANVSGNLNEDNLNKGAKLLRTRFSKQQQKVSTAVTRMSIGTNTPPVEDETVFTLIDTRTNVSIGGNPLSSSKDSFQSGSRKDVLPPTPPTSISAPSTPPATLGGQLSSNCNSLDVPPIFHSKKIPHYDSDQDKGSKSSSSSEDSKSLCTLKTPIKIRTTSPKNVEASAHNEASSLGYNSKIAAINLEISKLSTKNIIEHSKIMSLHHMNDAYSIFKVDHDSSGDDTSSRGTLDSIIPPPANFQGENNPFHWQESTSQKNVSIASKLFNRHSLSKLQTGNAKGSNKNQRISLPVNLNPVIAPHPHVRPLKRHLSEKDLVIGPNGEVKRRRLRRPRKALQITHNNNTKDLTMNERQKSLRSSIGQGEVSASKITYEQHSTRTFINVEVTNQQVNTCVEYTQNGRTLRQRQEKNYCDGRRGSTSSNNANVLPGGSLTASLNLTNSSNTNSSGVRTLNLSPQKISPFKNNQSNPAIKETMHELKNSVHSYFGALNRIHAGEKFTLIGKRLTENGNVQYLIEWDGHGS